MMILTKPAKLGYVYLSKKIIPCIPVLLVDFSEEEITCCISQAQQVILNLAKLDTDIYVSQEGRSVFPGYSLPYWWLSGKLNPEFVKLVPNIIQICGLYKELCLFQVAFLLKNDKIPIIIDSADYTISASKVTVAETPEIDFPNRIKTKEIILF